MIKLIASDLDGTLLERGEQELDNEIFEVIRQLRKKNIYFVVASGRQYPNLRRLFSSVSNRISFICENGGLIMHNEEIFAKHSIDKEIGIQFAKEILETEHCELLISGQFTFYLKPKKQEYINFLKHTIKANLCEVDSIEDITEDFIKISVYDARGVEHYSCTHFKQKWQGKLYLAYSGHEWLDFTALQVNKGDALRNLCGKLGISREEVMVFGDNINDREMIQWAYHSYAMDEGREEIKKYAKYTTDSVLDIIKERVL